MPVVDGDGRLVAVLDVDATEPGVFDDEDARALERIVGWFAHRGVVEKRA